MPDVGVITGQIKHSQIVALLEQKLKPHLPFALPLYRRCQYHLTKANAVTEKHAEGEIWVVVTERIDAEESTANTADHKLKAWLSEAESTRYKGNSRLQHREWLAAHIDLSNPGETQVWLFGSWEPELVLSDKTSDTMTSSTLDAQSALFEQLYNHMRLNHIPNVPAEPTTRWQNLLDSGKLVSVPYKRSKVLFGGVSEHLWAYLQDNIVYGPGSNAEIHVNDIHEPNHSHTCRTRQDLSYLKYIIPPPSPSQSSASQSDPHLPLSPVKAAILPSDVRFGLLSDQHLQIMLDRSSIPRTFELLKSLVSTGLFPTHGDTSNPIAWGMLSKDASLSSLHTEPEYRGRGLAEHVCRNLATLQHSTFSSHAAASDITNMKTNKEPENANVNVSIGNEQGPEQQEIVDYSNYLHADVSESNRASRKVCEKLGGTSRWRVAWIEIDLGDTITSNF